MTRVFLDANVFFAAVRSQHGGSYFILELAKQRRVAVVTVAHALAEAERNIGKKLGSGALDRHYDNLLAARPRIQPLATLTQELEDALRSVLPEKDIPIAAGAFLSGARALVTLDRRHLLGNAGLRALEPPFSIMTPGDFLQVYFAGNSR